MIFSSLTFFVFLAVVLGLYRALRGDQQRRWMLLFASWFYYGWWNPWFLGLILMSTLWGYAFALKIGEESDPLRRKRLLAVALVCDLFLLGYFKYANFFIDSFAQAFGITNTTILEVLLPPGISFFTFQSMSYLIDVYRREIVVCHSLRDYMLFVAFFPQLFAGPIVRATEFLPQLLKPLTTTRENVAIGFQLFLLGLVQKLVFADNVATFVDPVFKAPALYDTATLWLAMGGYSLQIFCDFAGYSLMAIGLGRVLGFTLPQNFDMPYVSRSITEFWRRWHMSLSRWLRDYLYISLGGNRQGPLRTDVNLVLTMFIGGLWHGAGWNFVLWGGAHGLALMVHKHWSKRIGTPLIAERASPAVRHAYGGLMWLVTLLFVCVLWVPFRCQSFEATSQFLWGLVHPTLGIHWIHPQTVLLLSTLALWHVLRLAQARVVTLLPSATPRAWAPLWSLGLLTLALLLFAPFAASPFIYFQF